MSFNILLSYLKAQLPPHASEHSFEDWVSRRFGRKLYEVFFKTYTEKVWGIPCTEISASWAAQRIKGLSLSSAIKTTFFGDKKNNIKTLIDTFDYPKYGPGQMYEAMRDHIETLGSTVLCNCTVNRLVVAQGRIQAIGVRYADNHSEIINTRQVLSSMPITDLIEKLLDEQQIPPYQIARKLNYRSLLTVNLMFNAPISLPDTWLYIHEPKVKVGRIQCYANWSPYMVPSKTTSSLSLEYFCDEGDSFWRLPDTRLIKQALEELNTLKLMSSSPLIDAFVVRCPKAYPVYHKDYLNHLNTLKSYLGTIQNLQCIGRNGMFKYNNMDHSILSGLLAADNLCERKHNLWDVNTEAAYHEQDNTKRQRA